jgi:hypothetical protein
MTKRKRDRKSLIAGWKKLAAAVETHKNLLPALGPLKVALKRTIEEIGSTTSRRDNLEALRLEATQDLRSRYASGTDMVARMKGYVLARLGPKDARLPDFGINSGSRRRKPPEPERRKGSPGYH